MHRPAGVTEYSHACVDHPVPSLLAVSVPIPLLNAVNL